MHVFVFLAAALCEMTAGSADFNVRNFGAKGDGVANDTHRPPCSD